VQDVGHKKTRVLVLCSVFVIAASLVVLLLWSNTGTLHAQEDVSNMRSLLERLDRQIKESEDFQIAIQFNTPVVPDDETIWVIPDRLDGDDDAISRHINEIGNLSRILCKWDGLLNREPVIEPDR